MASGSVLQTSGFYNGHLTTGGWDVNSFIDALATEGLVTVLAEPNLTALSGETASFLAGGQFPVPVPQASNGGSVITIEFFMTFVRSTHESQRVRRPIPEAVRTLPKPRG